MRRSIGAHLVSAGVGLVAIAVALFTPMPFPVLSGFTYFLMGPAHWAFGVVSGRRRKALEGTRGRGRRLTRHAAERRSHQAVEHPARARVVSPPDHRRDGRDAPSVSTRTIRRDLEALQYVGFPIYDEVYEGKRYWLLEQKAFKRLDATGFTFAELSALYFSRTLVEGLAATPFQADVKSAFDTSGGGAHAGDADVSRSPAAGHPGQGRARRPAAVCRGRRRSASCLTPLSSTAAS